MLESLRKPAWLDKKISLKVCNRMRGLLSDLHLNTVCEEAKCPNISECFARGEATFMILGDVCTRNCSFCGVKKGKPEMVDEEEPKRVAEAVKRLKLKHTVITSVTRDDLELGGAEMFAEVISEIKRIDEKITVEVLIPDFGLNPIRKNGYNDNLYNLKQDKYAEGLSNGVNLEAIKMVVNRKPEIIAHNVETVPRLYDQVRSLSNYERSLNVLKIVKRLDDRIYTKSGIMLGLGEREDEVIDAFSDLVNVGCDFLSIGQYLSPSLHHYPIKEYIEPEKFDHYKKKALSAGMKYVMSAPYVRSSYRASEYLEKINSHI